jgi:hypothetical protein
VATAVRVAFLFVAAVLGLMIAASVVYFFFLFFRRPISFQGLFYRDYKRAGRHAIDVAVCIGAFIGMGIALFEGCVFILSWMPRRWVVFDEDGDPFWLAYSIAGPAAFFGALCLTLEMARFNQALMHDELTKDRVLKEHQDRIKKG